MTRLPYWKKKPHLLRTRSIFILKQILESMSLPNSWYTRFSQNMTPLTYSRSPYTEWWPCPSSSSSSLCPWFVFQHQVCKLHIWWHALAIDIPSTNCLQVDLLLHFHLCQCVRAFYGSYDVVVLLTDHTMTYFLL